MIKLVLINAIMLIGGLSKIMNFHVRPPIFFRFYVMVQSDSFKVLLSYLIFIEASFLFSGSGISKVQKREKLSQTSVKVDANYITMFCLGYKQS